MTIPVLEHSHTLIAYKVNKNNIFEILDPII